jgi:hypothetical protein
MTTKPEALATIREGIKMFEAHVDSRASREIVMRMEQSVLALAHDWPPQSLSVWCKPETAHMQALYTVAFGNNPIVVDLPLDATMKHLRDYFEQLAEDVK